MGCGACGVVCAGGAAKGDLGARLADGKGFGGALAVAGIVGAEDCAGCGVAGLASAGCAGIGLLSTKAGALELSDACSCLGGVWSCLGGVCSCLDGVLDAVSASSLALKNRDAADAARSNIDGLLVICVDIRTRSISRRLMGKHIAVVSWLLDA